MRAVSKARGHHTGRDRCTVISVLKTCVRSDRRARQGRHRMARGPGSRESAPERRWGRVVGLGGRARGGTIPVPPRIRRAVYRVRGGAHGLALHWFILSRAFAGGGGGGREPICFKAYVCGLASSLWAVRAPTRVTLVVASCAPAPRDRTSAARAVSTDPAPLLRSDLSDLWLRTVVGWWHR